MAGLVPEKLTGCGGRSRKRRSGRSPEVSQCWIVELGASLLAASLLLMHTVPKLSYLFLHSTCPLPHPKQYVRRLFPTW